MSETCLRWAYRQKNLQRGPFSVLAALAWFHNDEHGCFPSQEKIAEKTRYSRASVNTHLKTLETLGYISRQRRKNISNQQQSTIYRFPRFEADPTACLVRGTVSMSKKQERPCPESGKSRVQFPDTNKDKTKRTTTSKAVQNVSTIEKSLQGQAAELLSRIKAELLSAGKACEGPYWSTELCISHLSGWLSKYDLSIDQIVLASSDHASKFPTPPDGPKAFDKCVKQTAEEKKGGAHPPGTTAKGNAVAEFWAKRINEGGYVPQSAISRSVRDEIIARGLVSIEKMKDY